MKKSFNGECTFHIPMANCVRKPAGNSFYLAALLNNTCVNTIKDKVLWSVKTNSWKKLKLMQGKDNEPIS